MKNNGWSVIMRRRTGLLSFNRDWNEYKIGFGDLSSEHWIGLDTIHYMTNQLNHSLRIDLEDWDGNRRFAHYDHFQIKSELDGYELSTSGYSGDAGDSLSSHNGLKFREKKLNLI